MKHLHATISTLIILCFLLLLPTILFAKNINPYRATYAVKMRSISAGTITQTLKINRNKDYQYKSVTKSNLPFINLKITEISNGKWIQTGPHPNYYSYHFRFLNNKRMITSKLDWHKMIANTIKNGRHYTIKINKGSQDKLSYQLALRQSLLNKAKTFIYLLVDKKHLANYTFKIFGKKTLATPLGEIQTIKMQRINSDNKIIFWLAPKYDYLLIKIVGIKNGRIEAEANLQSYEKL